MKPEIVEHNGLVLDLSQVKCFKQEGCYIGTGFGLPKHGMIVEFKTRYDYIKHPASGKFIKQKYNETVEFDFPDFKTATTIIGEWEKIWRKYLEKQS